MRFCLSILLLFFSSFIFSYGQTSIMKGKVIDEAGKPLQGVNIILKGTNVGTTTNSEGNFSLTVTTSGKHTLIASITGYTSKEFEATNSVEVAVKLDQLVFSLQ